MDTLLIVGLGYSGRAVAAEARDAGFRVFGTTRHAPREEGQIAFEDAGRVLPEATHLLVSAPPVADATGEDPDPLRLRHAAPLAAASALRWIGYLSTTGVYGDRQGGWVDETTPPDPRAARAARRIAAERAWASEAGRGRAVDLIRLAGIYGPGRSAIDDLRAGRARPIHAPGHAFGRIHREDIARGVLAAIRTARAGAVRVLNFADDEPAESERVIAEAARLLGVDMPPVRTLEEAWPQMSEMARSFWSESRRVSSAATQAMLGYRWRYPTFREGLAACLSETV